MGNLKEFLVVLSAVLLLAGCGSPQNSAESGASPTSTATADSGGTPGLNSFVGEVLAMIGAAQVNIWYAILAAAGVIIAAIYMLWMIQRVLFGPLVKDLVKNLKDLSFREVVVLVPLAFWAIFLGVYPQPFFDRIEVSVSHYIEQVKSNEPRFAQDEAQRETTWWLSSLKP